MLSSFPVLIFPCNSRCVFKHLRIGEFGWHGSSAATNQPHLQEQYCRAQLQPAVFPTRGEQEYSNEPKAQKNEVEDTALLV